MFRKRRGIKLPYNKQGLIYFTCVNIHDMPEVTQAKIKNLCSEVTPDYAEALYTMLTDDKLNVHAIALRYHVCESQLYHYRQKFYEKWEETVITEQPKVV